MPLAAGGVISPVFCAAAMGVSDLIVIGNALPVQRQDGNPEMLKEYKQYNAFLEQKAASNPDLWVYDFYGVLAGPDGFLKQEYQVEVR